MAAGDSPIVAGAGKATYRALNSKLIGEAFDTKLQITASNENILTHLQGPVGSGKPFVIKTDLAAGAKEKINMNVGTTLGQAGRRGTQQAINYEEPLLHGNWSVTVDSLRVVVGWNEITAAVANTGQSWRTVYAELCGKRVGQIEQEDMLMRLRQRSGATNTIRPGNKTTLHSLRYDDVYDANTAGRAANLVGYRGGKPGKIAMSRAGMPIEMFLHLGSKNAMASIWEDPTFANAIQHAEVRGEDNPFWTGDIPHWKGSAFKDFIVKSHDNPGPTGSSMEISAILGDCSLSAGTTATGAALDFSGGTGAFRLWGGGRTQASLGNAAAIYKPFCYFYGNDYEFGGETTYGTDTTDQYAVIVDPADGKWLVFAYDGSTGIGSNGAYINTLKQLGSTTAGQRYTNLGTLTGDSNLSGVVYDTNYNKEVFPLGSVIFQCNSAVVPVGDIWTLAAECGGKCYGREKNKPIEQQDDYGALQGKGVHSIYGVDCATDTQGAYRGFVRTQVALQLEGLGLLPRVS